MKLIKKIKIPRVYIYGIDVIKNFLFFTLYIIITLITIAFIIAPSIKTFKKNQALYFETKQNYLYIKTQYNQTLKELNELKKQNTHILTAFRREFDIQNFKKFASSFMQIEKIKKDKTSVYKQNFIKTIYYINANIKSPQDFYNFADALKKYKYVIRVYFPIDFEKNKNSIELKLKIEHYRLKNLNALKAEEKAH